MARRLASMVLGGLFGVALASGAAAANPHFIGKPTVTDLGTRLKVTGTIAGLGNKDIKVTVVAKGIASITCTNPGGHVVPGKSTTTQIIATGSSVEVKNGRANFTVITGEPKAPAGSCPNPQWKATVKDVKFTFVTITVRQPPGGAQVLHKQFHL